MTESAANEVKRLLDAENHASDPAVRIIVTEGGCSGYEYRLEFDHRTDSEDDLVTEAHGVRLAVDRRRAPQVEGATIDFQPGLESRGFVFSNPLQLKTCGCGGSCST